MNTGLLRHAVATVLTVYGIETDSTKSRMNSAISGLQQCLPFTVLKQRMYTIENRTLNTEQLQQCLPFTVLKLPWLLFARFPREVATVLTVYGIETAIKEYFLKSFDLRLQQCLPFTVLKQIWLLFARFPRAWVATVLTVYGIETRKSYCKYQRNLLQVATVLTVYGIETYQAFA